MIKKIVTSLYLGFNRIINRTYNGIILGMKNVQFDEFPIINGRIIIFGTGKLQLSGLVKINSSLNANPIGGDQRTIFRILPGAELSIGDQTGISNSTFVCQDKITIGKNVRIGGGTKIYDTDFHSLDASLRSNPKTDIPKTRPVLIQDGAFIGGHSIILKGSNIGKNAIIGAGSVVTGTIPDNEIWGGNPVKFIRKADPEKS
ncbi:acyltransferase [Robertkochia solimangrovi]|uniref:acyltransferase n=1 Tax=Robertkochia solimangrovi TaxID=2213046 RepID=UPI00117C05B9|nr:acyltransferase [Robertkochia solimangrovi]TRZ45017.1 acyltransferase [Robertkochia solimangrovi]